MKRIYILTVFIIFQIVVFAQGNIGVGTSNPDNSAILDVSSTSKGVLYPRLTTSQRDAITSPAIGLVIFNKDCENLNIYTSIGWKPISTAGVPTALAATSLTSTSFVANWNAAPGNVQSYSIDVATNNTFSNLVVNNQNVGNVLTYNVTGLSCGTAYYYRVRANYCAGGSDHSNTIGPIISASHASQSFTYTGSEQSFNVPCGITTLNVQLWGAGGAGGYFASGGSGAYVSGTLTVTPNSTIKIIVGQGGAIPVNAAATAVIGYGGGAGGGYTSTYKGGGGGGRSAIQFVSGTDIVTAGGGGGGGGGYPGSSYNPYGGAGGAGVGSDNYYGPTLPANLAGGRPGTTSAGGAGGAGYTVNGASGVQFNGGAGAIGTLIGGGGGGGGYYGGGGGGGAANSGLSTSRNGGGGGGASYTADASFSGSNTQGLTGTTATVAAPFTSTNYVSGVGQGGASSTITAGGNGLVVITW